MRGTGGDRGPGWFARLVEGATGVARRGPDPPTVARAALGTMLLVAGVHKLLAPVDWAAYVVDWLAPWLVVSPVAFMLANGVAELAVGLALLADRWTAAASAIAAVSLTATVGYLAVVAATQGQFGDVLARDVGLAGLAWAVLVGELRRRGTRGSR